MVQLNNKKTSTPRWLWMMCLLLSMGLWTTGLHAQTVTITCTGSAGSFKSGSVNSAGTKNDGNMVTINSSANRGWAHYDLTSIPASAIVSAVTANFTTYSTTLSGATNNVYGFTGDPFSIAGTTLYANCASGTSFNASTWSANALQTKAFNATGIAFIQANVGGNNANIGYVRGSTNTYNIGGYPGNLAAPPNLVITYTVPAPCVGTPAPGNTLSTAASACTGVSFTLSLQFATSGSGVTYQWQTSPDNITYTNVGGATTATYATTQSSSTYYRCEVSCSGTPGLSNPIQVTQNAPTSCYCTPTQSVNYACCAMYVSNVNTTGGLTNFSNTSAEGAASYQNYSGSFGASQLQGSNVTMNVTTNGYGMYMKVWIDFNDNGVLNDAGELVLGDGSTPGIFGGTSPATFSQTFTVPASAPAGTHRMRVRAEYYCANSCNGIGYPADPCGQLQYGETEDYALTVVVPTACSGTPVPGNTLTTAPSGTCPSSSFSLSLQNAGTIGSGATYQWQSSPDNITYANIGGATNNSYTGTQASNTYYRCEVTCTSGPATALSNPVLQTTTPAYGCFCTNIPTQTADEEIYQISVNGASTPAAYANTNGCTTPGPGPGSVLSRYSNFTTLGALTTISPGQTVSFEVRENECDGPTLYSNGIGVWIDYNHNGLLTDAGETIFVEATTSPATGATPGGDKVINGTFTVPMTALSGLTGMRFIAAEGISGVSLTPCVSYSYGETEDWAVNIVSLPANPANPIEVGIPNCATGGTLQAVGSAPSGEAWYWQTTASGTSTSQPATVDLNILSNGTYYIRSYNATYNIWSAGAGSITVTDFPVGPADPTVSAPGGNPACGAVSLVSSTALAGTTNYWQGTNAVGTSTASIADNGSTNNPYAAPANGIYYIRAQDNTSFCWSNPVATSVTIYPLPTAPILGATPGTICPGSATSLTAIAPSAPPTGYTSSPITYNHITPVSPTTLFAAGAGWDDSYSSAVTLPFSFNFYGTTYNSVVVATNGYVQFAGAQVTSYGQIIPNAADPNNRICGVHNDLIDGGSGSISYFTSGTAPNRIFTVEFLTCGTYGAAGSNYSAQIDLYETTGLMEVHVAAASGSASDGAAKTIGVEDATGTAAAYPANRNGANGSWDIFAGSPEAYRFSPVQAIGFLWTPNGVANGIAVGDEVLANINATPSSTITYTMTLTDPAHGCTNSGTVLVTVAPTPPAPIGTGAATTCGAGTINVSATGTGGTLNWYDAATGGNLIGSGATQSVTVVNSNVTVWVEENNGTCSGPRTAVTATYTVPPSLSVGSDVTFVCYGGVNSGAGNPNNNTATLSASGTGYTSFVWTSNPAGFSASGASVSATPSATTTYTCTASGAGCTAVNSVTINGGVVPVISSVTATPATVCQGNTSQIIAAVQGGAGGSVPSGYCTPIMFASNACNYLNSVSTTGGSTNFNNVTGAYNGTGFTYFPSNIVAQALGSSFTLTCQTQGTCGIAYYNVWVDWNRDGDFNDAGENVVVANGLNSANNATSFVINIPITATPGSTRIRVLADGNSTNPVTACDDFSGFFSEIEDYVVDIQGGVGFNFAWTGAGLSSNSIFNPVATLGSPSTTYNVTVTDPYGCYSNGSVTLSEPVSNPGNTLSTLASVCPTATFTLSMANPPAGASYQWQSSPNGTTWTNIGGATNATYATTQSVATYYRCGAGCAGNLVFSNPLQVLQNNFYDCYCTSAATNNFDEEIYSVTVNGASTPAAYAGSNGCSTVAPGPGSSLGLYSNFMTLGSLTSISTGIPISFNIAEDECDGATYYAFGTAIWIDMDQNGVFDDATEKVFVENATATGPRNVTGTFTVPLTALSGITAMRITVAEGYSGTILTSCLSYGYGETEDFLVTVGDANCISLPTFPLNGGTACPGGLVLTWPSKAGATGYDVYIDGVDGTTLVSANQPATSYTPVSQLTPGAYFWKVIPQYSSGSCSAPQTWTFTALAPPDPSSSSNAPICEGNPLGVTSSNNASGQTSGNTYAWSGPSFTASTQNASVTGSATTAQSGSYTVTITNSFGCTASSSTIVTVNANPTGTSAPVGVSCVGLCDGGVVITPTAGLAPYIFTDGVTVNTDGIFTNAFCEGAASVDVFDDNGCTATIPFSVGHISSAPPNINVAFPTVPAYGCSGTTGIATTNPVNLATTYTWDGPAGTTFNTGGNPLATSTPSVTVNFGAPNGSGYNICVQAGNGCGSTNRRCNFVRGTVNVPGVITPANNRTVECANTSANYSIAAVTGATSYSWTSSNPNATVVGSGTTATVTFGAGWTGAATSTLSVTANTPCFSSAPRSISLSTSTAAPGAISGSSTACPGSSATYSVPATSGAATYNWVLPANTSGSSSTNSILVNFLPGFTFGDIKISITSICGVTSAQLNRTISSGLPAVPASVSGNLGGLCGQTTTFNCPSVAGASSYTWTTPGTINSGQGSTSINASFGTFTSGTVCVKANNGCGSSALRCVPVQGAPVAPGTITYSPNPICANASGVDLQVAPVFGASNYVWTFPAGVTSVLSLGNEQIVNWGAIGGTVTVSVNNACGSATKNQVIALGCREIAPSEVAVSNEVMVYPNPAHDKVNVQFNATEKTNYVLNLMDLSGRVISFANATAQKGINTSEIDLSALAKGVYVIELKSDLLNKQIRVVVE